ncbi:tyrosinase family oxidase copper chaperone [Streptomyces sp. NPDC050145]|uniref:tyrosinase family oxidase copper chaperone n=1 Tax=Streptomyces sp. NPDC050145 TaxID=3365602 RepID=UPI00378F7F16
MNPAAPLTDAPPTETVTAPPGGEPGPRRRLLTRRSAGLILLGGGATAAGLWQMGRAGTDADGSARAADAFDESYRGRRIQGAPAPGGGAFEVSVDGRPLHLMRRADGSYLSMVDHYTSHPTARDAARGAVDELDGQTLRAHPMSAEPKV